LKFRKITRDLDISINLNFKLWRGGGEGCICENFKENIAITGKASCLSYFSLIRGPTNFNEVTIIVEVIQLSQLLNFSEVISPSLCKKIP
jgi:hypothetical protein